MFDTGELCLRMVVVQWFKSLAKTETCLQHQIAHPRLSAEGRAKPDGYIGHIAYRGLRRQLYCCGWNPFSSIHAWTHRLLKIGRKPMPMFPRGNSEPLVAAYFPSHLGDWPVPPLQSGGDQPQHCNSSETAHCVGVGAWLTALLFHLSLDHP